jgi:hypothetical protein
VTTKKPGPPPPLPHLTREQLRDLIIAERAGVKPDCVLCGQPVLEQTFTLGPGDEAQRMLINSPCGHAMTYGRQLAEQISASLPAEPATEATEPNTCQEDASTSPPAATTAGGVPDLVERLTRELHRRSLRLDELGNDPTVLETVLMNVRGEVLGLQAALGMALGGVVSGGDADQRAYKHYRAWRSRQEVSQ